MAIDITLRRVLAGGALILAASAATGCDPVSEPTNAQVAIGGLFSLTGNWSTLGQNAAAALELAVEDINDQLAFEGFALEIVPLIEDTRLEPSRALQEAQRLVTRGVPIIIGPQASAEVAELKDFVDTYGILLVSPSSTAGSLAVEDDFIFRFTPSDGPEGTAIAALMWDDGVRAVVPIWREDAGNAGLEAATRTAFTARGGTVVQGVSYSPSTTDFTATVATLAEHVQEAVDAHGADAVALYLAAFDEVVDLFHAAAEVPLLASVPWYGSDGVALSDALVNDDAAAEFAIQVGYPNPLFGLEEASRQIWEPLANRIRSKTGLDPDAFALAVYDAAWVATKAIVAAGIANPFALADAFVAAAENHHGATGLTSLNAAGDRRFGNFDFWAVRDVGGQKRWTRIAQYDSQSGQLTR